MKIPILIVEDDYKLREAIVETLNLSGYAARVASDEIETLQILNSEKIGLVISDVNLGNGDDGIALLEKIKINHPNIPVLIMTAFASVENAVRAMRAGAIDYLVKPFMPEGLISLVQRYFIGLFPSCDQPIAESQAMKSILQMVKRVAVAPVTILLTGASGTGKEVIAKYIHKCSSYSQGPFIAINCAAIPDNMLEALLFGYEKGAFTGAYNASAGKFELAQNGTLLLDEISELPLVLQAKLLRVLQEKEVERLGGKKNIPLNIRVVAATNKNLREEVENKRFREDLFFRLNVFPINIPPLENRKEDILPLTNRILAIQSEQIGCKVPELTEDAKEHLLHRKWLGNVRELENVLQRAMVIKNTDQISKRELLIGDFDEVAIINSNNVMSQEVRQAAVLDDLLRDQEYDIILNALQDNHGHREATAKELGVSSRTLRYKIAQMKEIGLKIPASSKATGGDGI